MNTSISISEKIRGALIGYALGDALGLGTEFMTAEEVKANYPEGLTRCSQIIRDAHRCQWKRGDWTNDTECLIMLTESVMERGAIDIFDYASRMRKWYLSEPTDLVSVFRVILSDEKWESDPIRSAHRLWAKAGLSEASNEAIQRALITGIVSGENLIEDTRDIIQITHDDTRCVSSAVVIARMAQSLMWEGKEPDFDEFLSICESIDSRTVPYIYKAREEPIEGLRLDDEDTLWYTRKTMSSALWALWHCDSATEMLHSIVNAGGDSDTNASLALALAGLKYGEAALPEEAKNLNEYQRISDIADRFADFVTHHVSAPAQ